jgi:simple sugar transport system ATP-binding protein
MVGEVPAGLSKRQGQIGDEVIRVANVSVKGDRGETLVDDVSLAISSGEIVGIGGVAGNGQVELAEVLAGVRPGMGLPPAAYIPEDRHRDGLALGMSLSDNLLVEGHKSARMVRKSDRQVQY